jgi:hypothetical protein
LTALVSWLLKQRRVIKVAGVVVAVLLIALNIFQTNQYASAVIEGDGMTKAYYWRVFGKMEATPKDKELLDRTP